MKITDAWIDDPTTRGQLLAPELCVEVDELPSVTIEPRSFGGGWSVGKYGPFIRFTQSDPDVPATAGAFNVRFAREFQPVVDVGLFLKDSHEDGIGGYALNVTRARQLIRKWEKNWRLLLSDRAAQAGAMTWVPLDINPKCRYWIKTSTHTTDGHVCGRPATGTVHREGLELPHCPEHMHLFNKKFAAKRSASSTSR